MGVPTPFAHQRDRLRVTNELQGRGRAEAGWWADGTQSCRSLAVPGGGCQQRGCRGARGRGAQGRATGDPRERGRRARGGRAPPCSSEERERGCGAGVRAGAPTGNAAVPSRGWGAPAPGREAEPVPSSKALRPAEHPPGEGRDAPVPPPRPAAADPPPPAAPLCAPSPAAAPGPAACGALRGSRCLPAGAVRCCPLPAGLPALSGAAQRAVGAALPQSGQGWAGGPSEWGTRRRH